MENQTQAPPAEQQQSAEPETLEQVKAVMEEHGDEKLPTPEAEAAAEEPAKAPAAKTEPEKKAEAENPAAVAPKGYVPQQALLEERRQRQERDRQFNLMQGVIDELKAQRAPADTKPLPEPDAKEDPDGWMRWKIQNQDVTLANLNQTITKQQEQARQRQVYDQLVDTVSTQEADYTAKTPEYIPSLRFLENARAEAYKNQGIEGDFEINRRVHGDKLLVAQLALQLGVPAPAFYHALAQNLGFKGNPVKTEAKSTQAADPATVDGNPDLKAAAAGQAAAKSLSQSSSSEEAGAGAVTLDTLSKLKGAAFDSAFKKFKQDMGL